MTQDELIQQIDKEITSNHKKEITGSKLNGVLKSIVNFFSSLNAGKVDKVNGKQLSDNNYTNTDKQKVTAIPSNPKYTDTVYDDTALAGRVSAIEGKESGWEAKQDALVSGTTIKTINGESILGSGNITISVGGGSVNAVLYTEQTLTSEQKEQARINIGAGTSSFSGSYNDLSDKPTIPASQIQSDWSQSDNTAKDFIKNKPTIPTVPTNVSAFTNDAGYLTQHQSLTNYVQKSQTAGLLKNDGTVDTNTYLTQHQSLSGYAKYQVVSALPANPESDTLYLIPES